MRIQNNIQKINFNGYKNLLYEDIRGENCSVSFFATQLNDQGEKDLTTLKETINMSHFKNEHIPNRNVLSMIVVDLPQEPQPNIFFNGEILNSGKELKNLKIDCLYHGGLAANNRFKKEENFALKAYTLLAKITRNMSEQSMTSKDTGMFQVMQNLLKDFKLIFNNETTAHSLMDFAIFTKKSQQEVGITLNNYIKKALHNYFK